MEEEVDCPHCSGTHPVDTVRCAVTLKKLSRQQVRRRAGLALQAQDGTLLRLQVGATVVLGRDPASPVAEACGDNVSKLHAEVTAEDADELVLVDTDSTNGTFVNDVRLSPGDRRRLGVGDVIELANHPPFIIEVVCDSN